MLTPSGVKIWRPRQLYVGEGERNYVNVEDRPTDTDPGPFGAPTQVLHGGDSKRSKLATFTNESGHVFKPRL